MIKKLKILCLFTLFSGSVAWAIDSSGNRKDQTVRLGLKSGVHPMYFVTSPFVLEVPGVDFLGEDWTFGLVYGSGDFTTTQSSTSYSSEAYSTVTATDTWKFSTSELTGRYYFGNSFNIPFGVAIYSIHLDDWTYTDGTTWDLDYKTTQLNLGIGNDWTFDWGGYIATDWFQGGVKLSDKVSVKQKSGSVSSTSKSSAEKESTDMNAFSGAFIVTFGFGF